MTAVFKIPYPKTDKGRKVWNAEYGMNAIYTGKHWSRRRQDAQLWHTLTAAAIGRAKLRKRPMERPVVITFLWNDRLDLSNHAYMAKLIEDGMKGVLIKDDSPKWVRGIEHYWHDEPCIKVIVTETGEERI